MDILATLFPSAFPALALSHFVALLSPGPDFFLLVGYAIRYRLRGSVGLCLGIAAGNGLYILLAIIGWGILRQAPLLFTAIELLGAAYLLWIGSLLLRSRPATLALHFAPAAGEAAFSRAGFFAAQSEKRAVLPRADDLPAGTERHAGAAGRQRGLDDQRGVDMGSVAGHADCATVGAAPPFCRRLASRAHGRRRIDGFWLLDCVAVFARVRRQAICLSLWKNSLN